LSQSDNEVNLKEIHLAEESIMKNRVYKKKLKKLNSEQKKNVNEIAEHFIESDRKLRESYKENDVIISTLSIEENDYLQFLLKSHMNSSNYPCTLKTFNPYKSVERDNDVSFVEVNQYKQSLIKKIRYTKKINNRVPKSCTAYQFINTFYCEKCNDYHISDLVQIDKSTFKKHTTEVQMKVKNALKPSERRMKNVKIKSLKKKSLTASEKSLIADFKSKRL